MKSTSYDKSDAEKLGRIWLDSMVYSHQAYNLNSWPTYTLSFSDEFFGVKGLFANPFRSRKTMMELHYIPNSFDGRADFENGRSWILQSSKAFKSEDANIFTSSNSKKIKFWLPTYQYFFELPNRIGTADIIRYAGEGDFDGRIHQKVFASWKTETPHAKADQFILWIDLSNGRLSAVEFTIRDQKFASKAMAIYYDYTIVHGYLMPQRIEIKSTAAQKSPLHEMQVYELKTGVKDISYIRMKNNIEVLGDKK